MKKGFYRSALLLLMTILTTWSSRGFGCLPGPDSLSIDEALRIVVSSHPAIAQATAAVDVLEARIHETQSSYFPTVDAEASYLYLRPIVELPFPGLGDFILFPANNYDAHIRLRQLIYDFGKTSTSVELGVAREGSALQAVTATRSRLAYQTIQTFYSILLLERSIAVEDREIETLNEHKLVNQKRVDAGSGTEFEVLTTQVRVAAAQTRRIDLQNSLDNQRIALRRLLGLSPSAPLAIHGEFIMRDEQLDVDALVTRSLLQRADYRGARDDESAASLQHRLAGMADLPSVSFMATYGVKNGYLPNLDVLRGNWTAGVELQVPIYTGGKTGHREQEEAAAMRGVEAHLSDIERQIQSEVRGAVVDVQAAAEKVKTSELQVRQAEDALSIARKRYEAGTVSNLDVLDAETSLSQADLLQLRAQYGYVISRYALDRAVGNEVWRENPAGPR